MLHIICSEEFEYICGRKVGRTYYYTLDLDIIHVALLTSYTDWHLETPLNVYLYRNEPCGETWILVIYIHNIYIFVYPVPKKLIHDTTTRMDVTTTSRYSPTQNIVQPNKLDDVPPHCYYSHCFCFGWMGGNCEFLLPKKSSE